MKYKSYSATQAAEILGIPARTIRHAVKIGELPCIKWNARNWKLSAVDVSTWYLTKTAKIKTNETSVTTPPDA
jgi:excisionase family DNA binding protein